MANKTGSRHWFLLGFLLCVLAMTVALYFQLVMHLEPCPLCIFQRVAVIAAGIVFLIGALHNPKRWGIRIYAFIDLIVLAGGLLFSARQIWLQHLPPDQVPACGPGLNYLVKVLPWQQVVSTVFNGSGECAAKGWVLLGLSLAEWTAVLFVVLMALSVWLLVRRK
jgi:disulfide bond formation protein DsbB